MAQKKRSAKSTDPGQYLPLLAVAAANRARMPKEPLTRSAALAAAPWPANAPPAWERAFRAAYADRLEERGAALPVRQSARDRTGAPPGAPTKLDRRLLSQTTEEFAEQSATAEAAGLSWSTWARRKLAT